MTTSSNVKNRKILEKASVPLVCGVIQVSVSPDIQVRLELAPLTHQAKQSQKVRYPSSMRSGIYHLKSTSFCQPYFRALNSIDIQTQAAAPTKCDTDNRDTDKDRGRQTGVDKNVVGPDYITSLIQSVNTDPPITWHYNYTTHIQKRMLTYFNCTAHKQTTLRSRGWPTLLVFTSLPY